MKVFKKMACQAVGRVVQELEYRSHLMTFTKMGFIPRAMIDKKFKEMESKNMHGENKTFNKE